MRDRWKIAVGGAALALAAIVVPDARAGNAEMTGVEYFSVALQPGQTLAYAGQESDATLLIDDITYSAQIDPCDLFARCEFFTAGELAAALGNWDNVNLLPIFNMQTVPAVFGGDEHQTTRTQRWAESKVLAKGSYLGAELSEGPGGQVFDAVSHTLYGEGATKFKRSEATLSTRGEIAGVPSQTGNVAYATDAFGYTETEALAISLWAVQTSESRHYQTPQIVQDDGSVSFNLTTAVTDYGSYVNAVAYIKGRVIFGTTGIPVENTDIAVTGP